MPLRAVRDGQDIFAFDLTAEEWADLKNSYRECGLRMHCCASEAVPCTRQPNTFYFRHKVKGGCTSLPESEEHLYLKTLVARAAKEEGWEVFTEWPGASRSGEHWEADVLCRQGNTRIAVEIQTSYQSSEELRRRTKRYSQSNVFVYWLAKGKQFKPEYIAASKELPFFRYSEFDGTNEPHVHGFGASVSEFTRGILSGRLEWKALEVTSTHELRFYEGSCQFCGAGNRFVCGLSMGGRLLSIQSGEEVLGLVMHRVPNEALASLGLAKLVQVRKGAAEKFFYQCSSCHRAQGVERIVEGLRVSIAENAVQSVEYSYSYIPDGVVPKWHF